MAAYHDDVMLIDRAQRGDRSAFDTLMRRYEERAYQFAFRLTRNAEEASDVVAQTFIRIYGALRSFKGQSAFTTWLYRILTNCFLDLRKKERSRPAISMEAAFNAEDGLERQVEDTGLSPWEYAERGERESTLQQAVAKLPKYQRAILLMFHVQMLSYEEISKTLDLPMGTVKSRLNRARMSVRELLANETDLFYMA